MALSLHRSPPAETSVPEIGRHELDAIRCLLETRTGFPLFNYKENCVMRRITIRIRATNCADAAGYCRLLEQDDRELEHLHKILTIHVSHFFRNPSVFETLRDRVIPGLFISASERNAPLVLRSIGCSTGEEPYSLAILLKEHFRDWLIRVPVRIIGTDINAAILDQARRGIYPPERVAEVPLRQIGRYFTPDAGMLAVRDEIRGMVTFDAEDIFQGGASWASDMILCRNLLIYIERPWQEEILSRCARSLSGRGYLVLGKSETVVGTSRGQFEAIFPAERIYRAVR